MNRLSWHTNSSKMVKIVDITRIVLKMNPASYRYLPAVILLFIASITLAQPTDRNVRITRIQPKNSINCTSGPVAIGVTVEPRTSEFSYSWSTGQTDSVIYVKPAITTAYHLVVENQDLNFSQDLSFVVEVENAPMETSNHHAVLSNKQCLGDPVRVTANHSGGHAPFSYSWSTGEAVKSISVNPLEDSRYFVTITDACETQSVSEAFVHVEDRNPIIAPKQQHESFSCEGDELMLVGSLNGVTGGVGYGYQFTFSDWKKSNEGFNVSAVDGMKIPVKVSDACRTDIATVEIMLHKSEIVTPDLEDLIVCVKDTTDIMQDVPDHVYYWNGSGFKTSEQMVISQSQTVSLTYIDRCSDKHLLKRKIEARDPLAEFDYQLDFTSGRVETSNSSQGHGLNYRWSVNGLLVSESATPSLQIVKEEENEVVLEIEDDHGCVASISRRIAATSQVSTPSAFTPNGDGKNDFYSVSIGEDLVNFKFQVFDRWGQLVYSTNDQYFVWDGRHNSSSLPMSTYVFIMKGETADGEILEKFGTITILNE